MPDTLAIDADILAFRIAAVCEDEMKQACDDLIDAKLNDIVNNTGVSQFRLYISGANNFRYDVAVTKPYKGNREGLRKPQHLPYVFDYMRCKYAAITVHGYEADDGIASDMTQNGAIHCGVDKDILQIEGRHYDFVKEEWQTVDKDQATLNLFRQILTGDSADNIQGLPKVGEKTAAKIIQDPATALEDAKAYYKEICEAKLPDVVVADYWKEQVQLIELVKDLNVIDLMTNSIKVNLLRI